MKTIDVILGSARSNSSGAGLFNYLKKQTEKLEKENEIKLNFMDIRDFDLPIFNEPIPPMSQKERHLTGGPKKWIENIAKGDGYLFIEPVYDNGLSGAFKNGIDYIGKEAAKKPARIVCYSGGASAGRASALACFPIFAMLGMITLPSITAVGHLDANFQKDGNFVEGGPSSSYYAGQLEAAVADVSHYAKILGV